MANNADPDEMPHYAAFHLGLCCLPKNLFKGFRSAKVEEKFQKDTRFHEAPYILLADSSSK